MTDHLGDLELSDAVDDVASAEVDAHLVGCASCRVRLEDMRTAVAAMAAPPPPPDAATRDAAIAAALGRPAPSTVRRAGAPRWMAAAAAVAVLLAGAGVVLAGRDDGGDDTTAALSRDEAASGTGGAAGDAVGFIDGGDLGNQSDAAALHALLESRLPVANATERSAEEEGPFAAGQSEGASEAPEVVTSVDAAAAAGAPPPSAPLVCIAEAQAVGAGRLGTLLYGARLRWQGRAAVVLVFAGSDQSLGRQAFVMARRDCQLLVAQSF